MFETLASLGRQERSWARSTRGRVVAADWPAPRSGIQHWKERHFVGLRMELCSEPKALNSAEKQLLRAGVEHGHSEGA